MCIRDRCHSSPEVYSSAICNAFSLCAPSPNSTTPLVRRSSIRTGFCAGCTWLDSRCPARSSLRRCWHGETLTRALVFTSGSALYSGIYGKPLRTGFFYSQSLFDLLVVTTIVHVTGSGTSQFAALYILVIAAASLLLPYTGGLLIAALGCVLYFADVIITPGTPLDLGVWLQLGVFAAVALGSGYIAARLRQAGAGTQQLAAELVKVRLQAADILKNIRSAIVTVDAAGGLVYANPAASQLLGIELDDHVGSRVIETISVAAPELARALGRAARDGTRTSRAEGSITVRDRRFPIGLNTTRSEGDGAATATAT